MSLSQTLLPLPFKGPDKKVKSRMLSMPNKLRAAAMELLERLRLGLDIPSRAEVLELAERIEAISTQLSRLEAGRATDNKLVEELRLNAAGKSESAEASTPRKIRRARKKPAASGDKDAAPTSKAPSKAKARTRKAPPAADDK